MRGKATEWLLPQLRQRITPAYAGKSIEALWDDLRARDHPRLCGEKPHSNIIILGSSGSPPPMRGKVPVAVELDFLIGITPAYAGKRSVHRST